MEELFAAVGAFWESLPSVVKSAAVLALGWAAARLARLLVSGLLALVRVDRIAERTGLGEFLRKGNVGYSPSRLAGHFAYWLVMIAAFVKIALILDVRLVEALSDRVVDFLPSVMAAALILAMGALLVSFVSNFARTIARNAAIPSAGLLAKAIKYAGNSILALLALEQIGLGATILSRLLELLVAAAAFGVALAFGLGCKDMAKDAMQGFLRNLRERERGSKGGDLEG